MRALPALLLSLVSASASAALMEGQTVTLEHLFPTTGQVDETIAANVVVGDGIEGTTADGAYQVDISDRTIVVTELKGLNWTPAAFNGLRIYAPGVSFFNVFTNLQGTNFQHWCDGYKTFDAHNIYLNFEALSILEGQTLTLDLNRPNPIPEPATYALMVAGLIGLSLRRARPAPCRPNTRTRMRRCPA